MNSVLVIPSIDIQNGVTVRVVQGIPELNCAEYCNDPIETAMLWRAENAKAIHVVDFNAAHSHSQKNFDIIAEMCESVIIPIQLGGGIRTFDDAQIAIELGVFRLVIGTMAFTDRKSFKEVLEHFGPSKIAAAIDVIDNEVVINGRQEKTGLSAFDYAKQLSNIGVKRFVVTDVKTNGMLTGPNIDLSRKIALETGSRVTLSGGVGGYQDLYHVNQEFENGIDSVIIGRALYENAFPCQKIWRVAESGIFN
jgi:phosphoribosylformimino-5-aminoimidazole carboxamide ribotide isomerase